MDAARPRAILGPITAASGVVSAASLALLALLVVTDIAVRNLALARWPWMVELTEYLLTIATFCGAPWVLARNGHVNIDILLRLVGPRGTKALAVAADAAGLVICALVAWLALMAALDARSTGSLVFKNISFPEWYLMVPVLWCFTLCALEFLGRLLAREARA